jgi:hypothetical protein
MPGYSALSSNVRSRHLNRCVLEEFKFLVLTNTLVHASSVWAGANPLMPNQSQGDSKAEIPPSVLRLDEKEASDTLAADCLLVVNSWRTSEMDVEGFLWRVNSLPMRS